MAIATAHVVRGGRRATSSRQPATRAAADAYGLAWGAPVHALVATSSVLDVIYPSWNSTCEWVHFKSQLTPCLAEVARETRGAAVAAASCIGGGGVGRGGGQGRSCAVTPWGNHGAPPVRRRAPSPHRNTGTCPARCSPAVHGEPTFTQSRGTSENWDPLQRAEERKRVRRHCAFVPQARAREAEAWGAQGIASGADSLQLTTGCTGSRRCPSCSSRKIRRYRGCPSCRVRIRRSRRPLGQTPRCSRCTHPRSCQTGRCSTGRQCPTWTRRDTRWAGRRSRPRPGRPPPPGAAWRRRPKPCRRTRAGRRKGEGGGGRGCTHRVGPRGLHQGSIGAAAAAVRPVPWLPRPWRQWFGPRPMQWVASLASAAYHDRVAARAGEAFGARGTRRAVLVDEFDGALWAVEARRAAIG
jgi:hypothetical protein